MVQNWLAQILASLNGPGPQGYEPYRGYVPWQGPKPDDGQERQDALPANHPIELEHWRRQRALLGILEQLQGGVR